MKPQKKYSAFASIFLISTCIGGQPPSYLTPGQCQKIMPFSGCDKPVTATIENCNALAKRNTPAFVFKKNSAPICLGPSEVLIPLEKLGVCQRFDQNGTASQCDNQLLMNCFKSKLFPAPVWVIAPEKFGEFTVPRNRQTPASNAEVCFWYENGKGAWPIALTKMVG